MREHRRIQSPVGDLFLVAAEGKLVGIYHLRHDPPPGEVLLGKRLDDGPPTAAAELLAAAAIQLEEYFSGARRRFDLPMDPTGTGFQHRVWDAVLEIPYGETRTYRSVAALLGNPAMGRAVGAAIRLNPLSILIPGHRVVSGRGTLTGYAAGVEAKQFLLVLESANSIPGQHNDPEPNNKTQRHNMALRGTTFRNGTMGTTVNVPALPAPRPTPR